MCVFRQYLDTGTTRIREIGRRENQELGSEKCLFGERS